MADQVTRSEAAAHKGYNQSLLKSDVCERDILSRDNCTTGCDDSTIKSSHGKAAYGASARLQIVMIHLSEDISWPFDLLKKKLMLRLDTLGIHILKTTEEEWSYIAVGGSLPNTEQKNLAVGLQLLKEPFPLQNSSEKNTFHEVKSKRETKKENLIQKAQDMGQEWTEELSFKLHWQIGANHIIRGLRNASPAPIKATIDTIPCSIKESNPVIPPSGVRNRNITEEHTPFKSTSSSDDLTELKKSKATENEPYQIFLCESISKKEIAVKKSANSFADAASIVLNKPHGMAVQGGTGVKASIDELHVAACLIFDKSRLSSAGAQT
ncbi:hypothetical protein DY000_02042453 [Brassica cretica]|uniref:Uncharacterized protein n=1 Tax=Brassica cretica TaxID=69181 RepID=A0ABQ7B8H7_BRACR|nr:hypothetical protein DY000_02042453 [Brassica cretica]